MRFSEVIKYYSKESVKEQLLSCAKSREVVPSYGGSGFGKRPSVILNEQEFQDLAWRGATSFHASEERWLNPLNLEQAQTRREQDELRTGWDLIFDIDTQNFSWAKKTSSLIVEYLREINKIKTVQLKFSGNKGFHIAVPFESFPSAFGGVSIEKVFPEAPRIIALYLKERIGKYLEKEIGQDPFLKVELDTIFIASRHLFRMPYSLHEKSGLVSLPMYHDEIERFTKEKAKPSLVEASIPFLNEGVKNEASLLFNDAFFWNSQKELETPGKKVGIIKPKGAIPKEHFPPCITQILNGLVDGRKRGLFILLNFLNSSGWSYEQIETEIEEWNSRNYEPLREGYLKSQLNWHKKLKGEYPPPNCPQENTDTNNYYIAIGTCKPDSTCRLIKNPASYAFKRSAYGNKLQQAKRNTKNG